MVFNTLRPRQDGPLFADDIFKCIFLNENISISIKISLKFIPKGPIDNTPALVQIMSWCRLGDKPLYEPKLFSLLTTYMRHLASMSYWTIFLEMVELLSSIDNCSILQNISNLRMLSMLATMTILNILSHNSLASLIPMVNLHLLMQSISGWVTDAWLIKEQITVFQWLNAKETHWSYVSLALSYQFDYDISQSTVLMLCCFCYGLLIFPYPTGSLSP